MSEAEPKNERLDEADSSLSAFCAISFLSIFVSKRLEEKEESTKFASSIRVSICSKSIESSSYEDISSVIASSDANAKEIRCSTESTEIHGTLSLGEMSLIFDSKKEKKNSVVEKSESENASVGQTPIHAAASTPVLLAKLGRLSSNCIDSGQASTHLVHSENFDVALTQAERLK